MQQQEKKIPTFEQQSRINKWIWWIGLSYKRFDINYEVTKIIQKNINENITRKLNITKLEVHVSYIKSNEKLCVIFKTFEIHVVETHKNTFVQPLLGEGTL
jgi:hypothetical protein